MLNGNRAEVLYAHIFRGRKRRSAPPPAPAASRLCAGAEAGKIGANEETAMDVKAAVATGAGTPLEIMTVRLEGPKAFEVMVEFKATGICHTDEFPLSGADPEGLFPAILG